MWRILVIVLAKALIILTFINQCEKSDKLGLEIYCALATICNLRIKWKNIMTVGTSNLQNVLRFTLTILRFFATFLISINNLRVIQLYAIELCDTWFIKIVIMAH